MSDRILTLNEVTNTFSEGLNDQEREANYAWTVSMYNLLNDGGVLGIPNTGQIFEKKLFGFVEIVPVEL